MAEQDQILLNTFAKQERDEVERWLAEEDQPQPAQPAPAPAAEKPAPKGGAAAAVVPTVPGTGNLLQRYITGPIGQEIAAGAQQAAEGLAPLPGQGGAAPGEMPGRAQRAFDTIIGTLRAAFPFPAAGGEILGDLRTWLHSDTLKDESLKAELKRAEDELAAYGPAGNPALKPAAEPDPAAWAAKYGPQQRIDAYKALLAQPYSLRVENFRAASQQLGQVAAGVVTAPVSGYTAVGRGLRALGRAEKAVAPAAAAARPAERPLRALPPASIPGGPSPAEVVEAAETARVTGTPEFQAWQARAGLKQAAIPGQVGAQAGQPALPPGPAAPRALPGRVGAQPALAAHTAEVRPAGPSSLEPTPLPPSSPQDFIEQAGAEYKGTITGADGTTLHQYRDPQTGSFDVATDADLENLPAKLADDQAGVAEMRPIAEELAAPPAKGEKDVAGIKQRMFISEAGRKAYEQLKKNEALLRRVMREEAGVARFFEKPKPIVSLSDAQANDIITASQAGGVTYSPTAGKARMEKTGFAVSVRPEKSVITKKLTPDIVKKFAADNADMLHKPEAHLGSWLADDGYHLDVSVVTATREEAFAKGREFNQRAIFDFATGQDINVPRAAGPGHPYELTAREELTPADVAAAAEYDAARTDLTPENQARWQSLANETDRLYQDVQATGLQVERVTSQPYKSAAEMNDDIAKGTFKVTTDNSEHPFWDVDQNWRFRVVHDYFGHYVTGNDFSLQGEWRAYVAHADMLPEEVRGALQTEVYGQAAAAQATGKFAEQKAFIPSPETQIQLPPPLERLAHGLPTLQAKDVNGAVNRLRTTLGDFVSKVGDIMGEERGAIGRVDRAALLEKMRRNSELWNDVTNIGAAYLWKGVGSFNNWSRAMLDEYSEYAERLSPILNDLYKASQARAKSLAEQATKGPFPDLKRVLKLAEDGMFGAAWYDPALDVARERLGADAADLYLDLVAAFSPRQSVDINIMKANEAFNLIMTGQRSADDPFKAPRDGMDAHIDNANRAMLKQPLSGAKVGPFARALKGDREAVVVDSWMGRMFGFGDNVADKPNAITFIQQVVTDAARKLQMDPRQVQAAMWSAFKVEAEMIAKIEDPGHAGVIGDVRSFAEIFKSRMDELPALDDLLAGGRLSVEQAGEKLPGWVTEEGGRVRLGTLLLLTRAAAGAMLGASQGESPGDAAMLALLGAGAGTVLSPRLAGKIADYIISKEGQQLVKAAFKSESGALDPSKDIGNFFRKREPSPNVGRMGAAVGAKRLVLDINAKLEKARKLERAGVMTHDETIAAALQSKYRNLDEVLGLDRAKLTLDELPAARTAARGVRDYVMEDTIEAFAKAKMNPDDADMAATARQKYSLAGMVSRQVTDFESWVARAQEAGKIESDKAVASKWDLDTFAKEVNEVDGALSGTVSDAELVKRVTEKIDRARLAKISSATSKYPQAFWNIYYGLNLLSSPLTHVKNILGDVAGMGLAVADRAVAEGIELIASPLTFAGARKQHVAFGETYDLVSSMVELIGDSFRSGRTGAKQIAGRTLRTGESAFGPVTKGAERIRDMQTVAAEGSGLVRIVDVMNTAAQANLRFMDATDEFFKVLSFHGEVRALARRRALAEGLTGKAYAERTIELANNPDKEILAAAQAFAHENTFTKAFDPAAGGWRHLWGMGATAEKFSKTPFVRFFMTPFFRTPTRLLEFSTVHTPILNAFAVQTYSDIAAGGAKAELALSKMAVGAGVATVAGWLAVNNLITGEWPKDPQLRAAYERAGWADYSVYVPVYGKYISYKGIEPLATMLGTVANFAQMAPHLEDHQLHTLAAAIVMSAAPSAIANPYAQGIADISDVITAAEKGYDLSAAMSFVAKRAASAIPFAAALRAVTRATDPSVRETKFVPEGPPETRELWKLSSEFMRFVPGLSQTRPAKVNMITGEPVAGEGLLGLINPWRITANKNDRVLNELVALGGAGLPREFPRVIGGIKPSSSIVAKANNPKEGVWLSDTERDEMQRLMTRELKDPFGHTLHKALEAHLDDDLYKDASDEDKALTIRQTFGWFYKEAEQTMLDRHPDLASVIGKRQLERTLDRLPGSMEDLKDPMRQSLDSILGGQR